VNLAQTTDGSEVLGCVSKDVLELALSFLELIQLEERASKRDARGKITRMNGETGAAGFDRLVELPGAAELLGELGKSDRRRVPLNPASKIIDALIVRHYDDGYGTVTFCDF
jgi:hypothetical protein